MESRRIFPVEDGHPRNFLQDGDPIFECITPKNGSESLGIYQSGEVFSQDIDVHILYIICICMYMYMHMNMYMYLYMYMYT